MPATSTSPEPDPTSSSTQQPPGHWLPIRLRVPLRLFSGALVALAVLGSAGLLLFDLAPSVSTGFTHAPLSAAPLLLIGLSYVCLQPLVRPRPIELLQRLMLGSAFILWGFDQLLPPGPLATTLGDIVITLYVLDLGLIIRGHLKREDWETP